MIFNGFKYVALSASLAAALAVSSCGSSGSDGDARDGKLEYEPSVNEVEVITLRSQPFSRQLVANGRLSAARRISMSFRSPGVIAGIDAENGRQVSAGDRIAFQDARDRELELESARIALDKAALDYYDVLAGQGYAARDTVSVPENVREMARMRSGYDAALVSLKKAELECRGSVLYAPFDGKVADIKLHAFDMSGSDPFCTLVDDSSFDVDFTVLESEYPFLEKGLVVRVSPFSMDGKELEGRIVSINPTVDKNGQIAVKATVKNDGSLIDGMNVRVVVERIMPSMLVVPKNAVVIRDNLEVLFRYSEGKAVWTYVNVLMSNSESHAVQANEDRGADLSEGDTVIVSGNLNIADGSEVTIMK